MNKLLLLHKLQEFFLEDIGTGDVSAQLIGNERTLAVLQAKEDGVFCGTEVLKEGYLLLDKSITFLFFVRDGEAVKAGDVLMEVKGPAQAILAGERVLLNLVQRMSGIASATKKACQLAGSNVRITDTRKTAPGLRMFDKYAVTCGGGYSHRYGLYDGIMLKDNHIAAFGSIANAIKAARAASGHMTKVEVEIETYEQLQEAIQADADIIMFDNLQPEVINEWLQVVPNHIITEASGGITPERLKQFGSTGVGYISLGYLTHSVKSLDISLTVKGAVKHDTVANVSK
ncbi:carboxylating nicotinate-nucleotide diphosphorylase [Fictibacillus iocasae]|uniref:nicotinate-nucleotide diphosphorylase (carboxylating) n=1 Tax=Fictibacillus iocasae TaxID=2715437 RepID=A0ABW2NPJ1_9BACL